MYRHPTLHRRQQGAILVVSLLLLLVMTVLALTASQSTRLQERMAGNARDLDLAFQAGEAGLRGAETRIDTTLAPKGNVWEPCEEDDEPANCDAGSRERTEALDFADQDLAWWGENAWAFEESLYSISEQPHFFTEVWTKVPDFLSKGGSGYQPESGTLYYVNTSRAQGATNTAITIVESTYAVRY